MTERKLVEGNKILTTKNYEKLVFELKKGWVLTDEEVMNLMTNPIAHFIASVPYGAKQSNPDQVAIFNLTNYLTINRLEKRFHHRDDQTIKDRASLVLNYYGSGDFEIIDAAREIATKASLEDHKNDFDDDIKNNHPNPLASLTSYKEEQKRYDLINAGFSRKVRKFLENYDVPGICWGWWK